MISADVKRCLHLSGWRWKVLRATSGFSGDVGREQLTRHPSPKRKKIPKLGKGTGGGGLEECGCINKGAKLIVVELCSDHSDARFT